MLGQVGSLNHSPVKEKSERHTPNDEPSGTNPTLDLRSRFDRPTTVAQAPTIA